MSLRWTLLGMIAVFGFGAINVNSLTAQPAAKAAKADKLIRVTYPIHDLIGAIQNLNPVNDAKPRQDPGAIPSDASAQMLIRVITKTIAANSWDSAGGKGGIEYFPFGTALVVNQTQVVQDQIAQLLTALRRPQGLQIQVEVRLVEVSAETAERMVGEMKKHGKAVRAESKSAAVGYADLDCKQLRALLEMAQADQSATIRQSPKTTVSNGKQVTFWRYKNDGHFEVTALANADQKNIRLALDFEHPLLTEANAGKYAIRSAEAFNVPANRTMIWRAGEVGGMHIFVAATARIVVAEEVERIFLGEIPQASSITK